MSISIERDWNVLLIDAAGDGQGVSDILGVSKTPGLTDYLLDSTLELGSIVRPSNRAGVTFLPCGSYCAQRTELYSSSRMRQLLTDLKILLPDHIFIIDGPSMEGSSYSRILADLVPKIIYVLEMGKTPQDKIASLVAEINPSKIAGLLLNKASRAYSMVSL